MANKKTPGVAKKKVNWKTYLRNTWQLYVMMLIPIIWLICFKYKPMLYIVVAFKKYNIFKGIWESPWVGFKYFKEAFGSSEFWFAVKNTLILNIGDLIIGFPFPIFLALFLNELRSTGVRKMTQIVLYLPNFLSWVIIAGISTRAVLRKWSVKWCTWRIWFTNSTVLNKYNLVENYLLGNGYLAVSWLFTDHLFGSTYGN